MEGVCGESCVVVDCSEVQLSFNSGWLVHTQAFLPPLLSLLPHFYFHVMACFKKNILVFALISASWRSQAKPEMQQPADIREDLDQGIHDQLYSLKKMAWESGEQIKEEQSEQSVSFSQQRGVVPKGAEALEFMNMHFYGQG